MPVTLRPVAASDDQFLFELYASTRREEVAAWGWDAAQRDAFLKMQGDMQRRAYEMQYPQADHNIIMLDDEPIGRLFVVREAEWIQLTDIALLPAARNKGIGSRLIKDLLDEADAASLPVRLQVLKDNPAGRLYERLGFVKTGESGMHFHMERPPARKN
jgi:ribosomal protein S18 acetylase RimI-like enzyme